MTVAELLPLLKESSYTDKLQILHFLTAELLKEAGLATEREQFEGAAVLAKALAEHQAATHG